MSENNNQTNSDIEEWKRNSNEVRRIFLSGQWGISMLSAFAFAFNAYQEVYIIFPKSKINFMSSLELLMASMLGLEWVSFKCS